MKAVLPVLFFATLGVPGGIFCAVIFALIAFWAVNGKAESAEDDE
ncbi:MAG TPA: hypothetical protein VLB90_01400 [Pseudomonadales bacterium]|nr:hypothetical protein [Pseudomonadales bacterium]